jgi:hypothetical protein
VVKVIQVKDAPSVEPQDVPDVGTFPMLLSDSDQTEAEWRAQIKKDGLPLEIKDVKDPVIPGTGPVDTSEGGES